MHRYISLLVTLSIAVLLGTGIPAGQALSEPKPDTPKPGSGRVAFAPDQILVKIKDNAPADALVSVNRRNGARVEEKILRSRVSVVDLPADLSVAEAVERYEASPEVEYAEPDYLLYPAATPNDPNFPKMYGLYNRGQNGGAFDADVDGTEAWNATTGNTDTVVAVIDTGMDINHPDLNDNIWTNPDEIAGNDKDDDRNGYVDDVHGWDFRYEDNSVFDGGGQDTHGTLVAGMIAAEGNNGIGVTGINWQAKIAPLKFIGADNLAYTSDAIEALAYAVDEGIEISNNSWGGGGYSQTLFDAIKRADAAGHLFVAAAGNGGADLVGDNNDVAPFYPASYEIPNIISVAASNNVDRLTSFSNYGATSVDLAAPGTDIPCTVPGNGYSYCWGTSIATPHVAGAAALVKSQSPQLSDEGIKARLLESVDKKVSLQGKLVTGGRMNAAKALGANTAPVVAGSRPSGRIRDRTPTISVMVWDDETELTKAQIGLYLDGRRKWTFSYNQATDTLSYRSRKLSSRTHGVRVVVADGQGLAETYTWRFRVVGHRR